MGLTRLILLLAAAFVLWRLWRYWRVRQAARRPTSLDHGRMLQCAHCGTYVPERDALREGADTFCCAAHRDAHRAS